MFMSCIFPSEELRRKNAGRKNHAFSTWLMVNMPGTPRARADDKGHRYSTGSVSDWVFREMPDSHAPGRLRSRYYIRSSISWCSGHIGSLPLELESQPELQLPRCRPLGETRDPSHVGRDLRRVGVDRE